MSIVPVSRLWLGAEVSASRGKNLITSLMRRTARCCLGPVLIVTEGLVTYVKAVKKAFSQSQPAAGQRGRPRLGFRQPVLLAQGVQS